jgi:hypothetical protein
VHSIEPFYNWDYLYDSTKDERSPYFETEHSEFTFSNTIYNYYVHPQWDGFGSENLYLKILFVDYEEHYCIIEMIGEWNDAVENDSSILKRNLIDVLIKQGIYKYILITENVLNYFNGPDDYYEEWWQDVIDEDGFIVWLNLPEQSQYDFVRGKVKNYVLLQDLDNWRTFKPEHVLLQVENAIMKRLG